MIARAIFVAVYVAIRFPGIVLLAIFAAAALASG